MQQPGSETLSTEDTSQEVTLTSDQYATLEQTISFDTLSATFSRELADGPSPSDLPDGQTPDLFGQVAAPANRSARPESGLALPTNGISGRYGSISSASAALQSSLASRLRQRSSTTGLTPFLTIWRAKATPWRRPYCQLALSGHRTSESGYGSLPTPATREWKDNSQAHILARLDRGDGVAKKICALSETLRSSKQIVGLNPSFAGWMMGYPPQWDACAPSAMRLSRKSRQNSSAPT